MDNERILGNHSFHGDHAVPAATKVHRKVEPTLTYGTRIMETLTVTTEVKTNESAELADGQAILELSAHDLALVGGGTANVCFM